MYFSLFRPSCYGTYAPEAQGTSWCGAPPTRAGEPLRFKDQGTMVWGLGFRVDLRPKADMLKAKLTIP